MLHAIIMAGGSGTRFWPASRRERPKQLLNLSGSRTMIQATHDRLSGLVSDERCHVMTNHALVDSIAEQLPGLPAEQIVGEPCNRDTAPCIGLAAEIVARDDPDGTMLVMPADHVIEQTAAFRDAIQAGARLIEQAPDRIVTFGIRPTYPAESFGYIRRGDAIDARGAAAYDVANFREKPDRATAGEYIASGDYYWNSGIFMWRASTIRESLRSHEPAMADQINAIGDTLGGPDFAATLDRRYTAIEGKSIDYAVMERHDKVVVVEAPFAWDDVGSWQALARLRAPDADGNVVVGPAVTIDTSGSILFTQNDHTIVTIDVEDLIVVHTEDATLVAPKHAEERVREAVAELKRCGLEHRT